LNPLTTTPSSYKVIKVLTKWKSIYARSPCTQASYGSGSPDHSDAVVEKHEPREAPGYRSNRYMDANHPVKL